MARSTTVQELAARESAYSSGFFEYQTSIGVISRRVLRRERAGSAVILIHEAPGFSVSTFDIAERLFDRGFSVILPELLEVPSKNKFATMVRLCIARELGALSHGTTSPMADWLRHLAEREHQASGERPVGVIGMCFSGGFALATILNEHVGAAVMSQPALPFLWIRDLGVAPDELEKIKTRTNGGECIRAMRFSLDFKSPAARLHHLQKEFPRLNHEQIPTWNPNNHSVLARALTAKPGSRLARALTDSIEFLAKRLEPDPTAATKAGAATTERTR